MEKGINPQIPSDHPVYEETELCNSVSKIYSQNPHSGKVSNILAMKKRR